MNQHLWSCINCGADLTGQRYFPNRHGAPRCRQCHLERCRIKREESRRQAMRYPIRILAKSTLLLLITAPLTYVALEVVTWASAGRRAAPAEPSQSCINC